MLSIREENHFTMRSMQALVKRERGPGLWLEEIPIPPVGEFDVLIRILRASICGTDVHIYEWDSWAKRTVPTPMLIGHEFVGIVESVGSHVVDFHPGEIVTGEGHIVCGRCRNCLAGRRHLCNRTSVIGVNRPGAFSQFLVIPQTNVWLAEPKISLDVLSCFDPLGNAVHTTLSFDVLGEDVVITGAGPIGMCHGGKIALLGIQSKRAAIDWDLVIFNGLTIKGIYGREMYETWYKMTTMIQSGLDISPVITHRFSYLEFEQAFQLMRSGQSGKIILHWSD
jgi:threonine dehydrogenase-like Zn-dependent dehydrogenase